MPRLPLRTAIVSAALAGSLLHGCRSGDAQPRQQPVTLMLYCGAGIRPAADALIRAFEATAEVRISATYAGSGRLLGQIASLQIGDLFMPGAALYVDKAIEMGLAEPRTKRTAACFVPVIFVPKGNPKQIRSLADLTRPGVRVGLGDERSCAVGRKTLKILRKAGIPYESLAGNVVYKSGTVNELGVAIQLGNVDAVIVWDAVARHFREHGEAIPIPPAQNVLSPVPIVVLRSSRHPREARRFIEFVTSERGKRILRERGYSVSVPGGQ